jgi:cardiolipin synthase A/B
MNQFETQKTPSSTNQQSNDAWFDIETIQKLLDQGADLSENSIKRITEIFDRITDKTEETNENSASFFEGIRDKLTTLFPNTPFLNSTSEAIDSDVIDAIDLLVGGEEAYAEIENQINQATISIEITIFIWRDDDTGQRLIKALLAAANRGVKITINKDRTGAIFEHAEQGKRSFFHPNLDPSERGQRAILDRAYKNPNEVAYTKTPPNPLLKKMLKHKNITVTADEETKDHSKYWIFDNQTIITGGMNVGDEYNSWHDYMVKVESPFLVRKLRTELSGKDNPNENSSVEFVFNREKSRDGNIEQGEIEKEVIELIGSAQKSITIEMAYFGDEDITKAIINAAKNGIAVRIILPKNANVQNNLNKAVMREILEGTNGNVSVYFYRGMLHAKMIHIDDQKTFLGSANLNTQATEKLGELNMLITNPDCPFTQKVREQLREDIAHSVKCDPPISYNRLITFFERKVAG